MLEDLSLLERLHHGLCEAVERGGVICFCKISARKYCTKHLARFYKYKSIDLPIIQKNGQCIYMDCNENRRTKGYCLKHYQAYRKRNAPFKKCSLEGCDNKHLAKGFCNKHYKQMQKNWAPLKRGNSFVRGNVYAKKPGTLDKKCIVPGCDITNRNKTTKEGIKKGLCKKHYRRWQAHGDYNVVLLPHGKNKNKDVIHGRHSEHVD